MKTVILLLLLFISQVATSADVQLGSTGGNVSQQTGGNYIYAENGKLTFNFEQSMFQNRGWKYDSSVDGAVTAFETNMPIKTKNSSTFHGYEVAANGEITLVAYYDDNVPAPMLMKPIYRKGYEGRTVHVWLPQAAGWVVRVVGKVARAIVPPIVTNAAKLCVKNDKCTALVVGNLIPGGLFCAINYYSNNAIQKVFKLPQNVCSKAEDDGWHKDENGQYVRDKEYKYSAHIQYGDHSNEYLSELSEQATPSETIGADTMEELEKKIADKCNSNKGKSFNELDYDSALARGDDYGKVTETRLTRITNGFQCTVLFTDENNDHDGVGDLLPAVPLSFQVSLGGSFKTQETLQFIDLETYVSEDFKQDPNPYINDTGEVGKEIREKIQSSAAIMKKDGGTGTLNLTSEPYKNPNTGETMQDVLSINSGKSWEIPPNAGGTGSSGGGGSGGGSGGNASGSIPQGQNDVTVNSIPRPDQSNNAKPAENNSPNGTGTSVSVGIGGGGNTSGNGSDSGNSQGGTGSGNGSSGNTGGNQAASGVGQGGLKCDGEHKGTLACASLGEVKDGFFDDVEIPKKEDATTWKPSYFLPDNGVCPQPKSFNFLGKPIYVSYEPICEFMRQIRFIILLGFTLLSAHIVFSTLRRK